jgi:DNA-binding ferritin-like protein
MNQPERSEAQKEASRINGAKSHGPVTDEGKAVSSQNAVKHGLYSHAATLINEDAEDFQAVLADYRAIHQPADREEDDIVRTMASAQFRKERMDPLLSKTFSDPPATGEYERV